MLAVGPMLTRTLEASEGLDVTILYATSIRPFDQETMRRAVQAESLIIVEPYYEGTTALAMAGALQDRAVRLISVGVPRRFIHSYGTPGENDAALGLDRAGIERTLRELLR